MNKDQVLEFSVVNVVDITYQFEKTHLHFKTRNDKKAAEETKRIFAETLKGHPD